MLGSGLGSTIDFFCTQLEKATDKPFDIACIVTENPKSALQDIAKKYQIPFKLLTFEKQNPDSWDKKLKDFLVSYNPDFILLAGFLKKIGKQTLTQFHCRVINSHPSLLPDFAGLYGTAIHQAVIQESKKHTGISIHVVNQNYDEGPLVRQKMIPVVKGETFQQLEERVKKIEKDFYFETIVQLASGKLKL